MTAGASLDTGADRSRDSAPDPRRPPTPEHLAAAAARIRDGALVAFPTETVYGLGAHALDADAVARIYAAKGRPAWNPVIAHVAERDAAKALAASWPAAADVLARACWPGPLTLVVPRGPQVPHIVTAGGETVGLRVPDHPVALALLRAAGVPIAAPSANRFTAISPTTAEHVVRSLGERVELVLDGGACPVGIESTVVDCTGSDDTRAVRILRPGMLDAATLARHLAPLGVTVETAPPRTIAHHQSARPTGHVGVAPESDQEGRGAIPRSPGMADRHYAPRADVWLVEPDRVNEALAGLAALRDEACSAATAAAGARPRARALWRTLTANAPGLDVVRMPADAGPYARSLYAALHAADADEVTQLLVELPPADDPAWSGIRDRLTRAAV